MIKEGDKLKEIANKFSIDPSAISRIKSGTNWSHITI